MLMCDRKRQTVTKTKHALLIQNYILGCGYQRKGLKIGQSLRVPLGAGSWR